MRIICIDDGGRNHQVLRQKSDLADYAANDAQETQTEPTIIETLDYDLVLMDLLMPGQDGLTALREIRACGGSKGKIPVLIVSAEKALKIVGDVKAAHDNATLSKSVRMDDLVDAIGRTLAAANEKRVALI
jgi:CheY-like chemotaxis protein